MLFWAECREQTYTVARLGGYNVEQCHAINDWKIEGVTTRPKCAYFRIYERQSNMELSQGSVTNWFLALQDGDHQGAQVLWERFSRGLIRLARQKLADAPRQAADEEDVALSAFDSFCRATEKGRFKNLEDRDDLWHLLVVITVRKAIDYRKYESRRQPREALIDLNDVLCREPGPELAVILAEEWGRLVGLLGDAELRSLVILKMEGHTDDEVAARLNCARRTVQRRLRLVRQIWEQEVVA